MSDFEVLPIGTKSLLADLELRAADAIRGIAEAVRVRDLMGRGGAARRLEIHGNNLTAVLRKAGEDNLLQSATLEKVA